ncbi:hypothetical protein DM02DRAFT_645769 [Periconia macrospinosa]|uniref:Peptidase S9 prolyl oligopeptidase catalytic domain-containing protein n=1 Tax=Periconia macrospinosa TaxID=97972 RepID=A0A2V1DBY5_9PLEO|nr:hypothetical protein DM02DRAFT_645769 [Periconia macrospinosa]
MRALENRQENASVSLSFGSSWQILGPFQMGTREATWGADPLEYTGGFRSLQYDPNAQFRSSLPTNGAATWNITEARQTFTSSQATNATLSVSHSNVNWDFLKVVYGWAAVQYQSWARGTLTVTGTEIQHVILYTDTILEFWVDGNHYFGGDFFTFRNAPSVLHLAPGTHQIDLRLVRDVRAFGGIQAPTIDVLIHAERVSGSLELAKPGILMSDVVDGKLASPVGSVALRNSGEEDIEIISIQPSHVRIPFSLQKPGAQVVLDDVLAETSQFLTAGQTQSPSNKSLGIVIAAGQTRPVAFNVSLLSSNVSSLTYVVDYRLQSGDQSFTLEVTQNLTKTSIYEPHKITFLHPGGMASYTMLRAPAKDATCPPGNSSSLPVLLSLHGAGLEADNGVVAHALDSVPDLCAWVLFPTGVTPWSGDDWHNWGFADVEAAIESIPDWIKFVEWTGPGVDINRWIVSGHSNGGQGTWYALTHRPDKVLAAAPVSGYASIQKYVPYELWQPADPRRTAVVSASLNSYRHEMLMPNARGIPIQQQHGEIDDNVPAYNSRLLAQQLYLSGTNSSYNEVAGQNHWWDTVLTTPQLVDFYYAQTKNNATFPRRLDEFEVVVGDPGDTGSKGGLQVLSLEDPGQYGRLYVEGHTITTSNVLSLSFDPTVYEAQSLTIDGSNIASEESNGNSPVTVHKQDGGWQVLSLQSTNGNAQRTGRQLGAMTAILRSQGPFAIQHQSSNITKAIALQISRNLYQYFHADAAIQSYTAAANGSNSTGNLISIVLNTAPADGMHPDFPISITSAGISVRDNKGGKHVYGREGASIGAAFLRPLADERLELVIWGSDENGLRQAARMVPAVTGVGQPDFVVLGKEAKWKGVDGALALGFFDTQWDVTASSLVS